MSRFEFDTTEDNEVVLIIKPSEDRQIRLLLTDQDISDLSYGYRLMEQEKTKKRDKEQEAENQSFLNEIESQGLSVIAKWDRDHTYGRRQIILLSDGTLWKREIGVYHYPWEKYDKIIFNKKMLKKDWKEKARWFERIELYKRIFG